MKIARSIDGRVLEVDLSRPPVNALNSEDLSELASLLTSIPHASAQAQEENFQNVTNQIHAVILYTGSGKGFNAGGDLKEIESLTNHVGILKQCIESARACVSILKCAVPVIVAVEGYCIGLGIEIVGSCDICVAQKDSEFVFREIDNGTIGGGSQAFRMLSPQVVRYLMFTGGSISASDLYLKGGISEIVSTNPLERAREIARIISQKDRELLVDMKTSLNGIEKEFQPEIDMRYEQGFIFPINIRGTGSRMRQSFLQKKSKL